MEPMYGTIRQPDANRIERDGLADGKSPAQATRATVLGRPIEHNRSPKTDKAKERVPWLGMHLVFRPPPTAHIAWALMDCGVRRVLELCQDIAVEDAEVGGGVGRADPVGERRQTPRPIRDGLIVVVFRHYESRAAESKPLLHDHALVSIRVRRPDDKGTWGNLSADSTLAHIVAADTLYILYFMEEVSARLGWAWEPREVTPGHRPVMEIAGIDQRVIGWQSTRRQQIEEVLSVLMADYEAEHGHVPGERASYALACRAADRTRPPKRKELRSLSELREGWRESAIRGFGADTIDRLAERARAAAAAVWARVRPVVDVVLREGHPNCETVPALDLVVMAKGDRFPSGGLGKRPRRRRPSRRSRESPGRAACTREVPELRPGPRESTDCARETTPCRSPACGKAAGRHPSEVSPRRLHVWL
ncbi:MobF family relaxase [Streptomyces sp. H27-S2]|uniref:MobF family relaxase n=1 Tax=Streptomyces antarcticus TaxID=2996458 RepID=UPI00226DEEDE|nr:MobF family relaxase [Streptomyces sp. H27-S2]MCY0953067.1 relaxase domain-containing protein [Streptomyces sp. H27-S2]